MDRLWDEQVCTSLHGFSGYLHNPRSGLRQSGMQFSGMFCARTEHKVW